MATDRKRCGGQPRFAVVGGVCRFVGLGLGPGLTYGKAEDRHHRDNTSYPRQELRDLRLLSRTERLACCREQARLMNARAAAIIKQEALTSTQT